MKTPEEKRRQQQEDSWKILGWLFKYGVPLLAIGFIIHILTK